MRVYADDPGLSREPLDSDYDDLMELLEDMKAFAANNRDHVFLCADDPGFGDPPRMPRMGWTAFLPNKDNPGDEELRAWTITLINVAKSLEGAKGAILRRVLKHQVGRQRMLSRLIEQARI